MEERIPVTYKYLRLHKKFPSVWCPGCGIGIVFNALIRAIDRSGLKKDEVAFVSGIGCSGRMPVYGDFDSLHVTHGRALAFATGLKLAKPDIEVITVMGDGDALAIGGNHFIHAARRNMDITAIIVNNSIYGMTGGQYSPTTPTGAKATTAMYGDVEQPFDVANLAVVAGAAFVARGAVYYAFELERLIEQAIRKKGFALVEVISHCHIHYGKMNGMPEAIDMLKWQKENTISRSQAEKEGGAGGKIIRGVLVDRSLPGYVEQYDKIIAQAQQRLGRAR